MADVSWPTVAGVRGQAGVHLQGATCLRKVPGRRVRAELVVHGPVEGPVRVARCVVIFWQVHDAGGCVHHGLHLGGALRVLLGLGKHVEVQDVDEVASARTRTVSEVARWKHRQLQSGRGVDEHLHMPLPGLAAAVVSGWPRTWTCWAASSRAVRRSAQRARMHMPPLPSALLCASSAGQSL